MTNTEAKRIVDKVLRCEGAVFVMASGRRTVVLMNAEYIDQATGVGDRLRHTWHSDPKEGARAGSLTLCGLGPVINPRYGSPTKDCLECVRIERLLAEEALAARFLDGKGTTEGLPPPIRRG